MRKVNFEGKTLCRSCAGVTRTRYSWYGEHGSVRLSQNCSEKQCK